jgi:hypothetical protein
MKIGAKKIFFTNIEGVKNNSENMVKPAVKAMLARINHSKRLQKTPRFSSFENYFLKKL